MIRSIINRIFGVGCAIFVNILLHYMPDGEVRDILIGAILGAGALAMINIIDETFEEM